MTRVQRRCHKTPCSNYNIAHVCNIVITNNKNFHFCVQILNGSVENEEKWLLIRLFNSYKQALKQRAICENAY